MCVTYMYITHIHRSRLALEVEAAKVKSLNVDEVSDIVPSYVQGAKRKFWILFSSTVWL